MPLSQAQTKVRKNSGVIRRSLCSSVLFLGRNKPNRRTPLPYPHAKKAPGNGRRGFPATKLAKTQFYCIVHRVGRLYIGSLGAPVVLAFFINMPICILLIRSGI